MEAIINSFEGPSFWEKVFIKAQNSLDYTNRVFENIRNTLLGGIVDIEKSLQSGKFR